MTKKVYKQKCFSIFRAGGFIKNRYIGGELPKKWGGGFEHFTNLRRGKTWQEREGW